MEDPPPVQQSIATLVLEFQMLFGKMDTKELFASLTNQSEAMITQLLWWARALKNARV